MTKLQKKWIILLVLLLVLTGLSRFNRQDIGAINQFTSGGVSSETSLGDAEKYIAQVSYFRGNAEVDVLTPPFSYRPFAPYIASFLPFDEMTSLNIVNYLSLILGLILTLKIIQILNFSAVIGFIAGMFYSVSFPVFYYGAIGYVDPVLIAFLTAALYFILACKIIPFVLLTLLACTVKETFIIILPIWFLHMVLVEKKGLWLPAFKTGLLSLIFIAGVYYVRGILPVDVRRMMPLHHLGKPIHPINNLQKQLVGFLLVSGPEYFGGFFDSGKQFLQVILSI